MGEEPGIDLGAGLGGEEEIRRAITGEVVEVPRDEIEKLAKEFGIPLIPRNLVPEIRKTKVIEFEALRRRYAMPDSLLTLASPTIYKGGTGGPVKVLIKHVDFAYAVTTATVSTSGFWRMVLDTGVFDWFKEKTGLWHERFMSVADKVKTSDIIVDEPIVMLAAIIEPTMVATRRSWVLQGLDFREPRSLKRREKGKEIEFDMAATPCMPLWHHAIAALWKRASEEPGKIFRTTLRVAEFHGVHPVTIDVVRYEEPLELTLDRVADLIQSVKEFEHRIRAFVIADLLEKSILSGYSVVRMAVLMKVHGDEEMTVYGEIRVHEFATMLWITDKQFDPVPLKMILNDPAYLNAYTDAVMMFSGF